MGGSLDESSAVRKMEQVECTLNVDGESVGKGIRSEAVD